MINNITKHVLLENEGYLSQIRGVMALLREDGYGSVASAPGGASGGGKVFSFDPTAPLNVRGMSALHLAAKHGASSLLQELITVRGVNVNIVG